MKLPEREDYVPVLEASVIGVVAGFSAALLSVGVCWLGALRVHMCNALPTFTVLPAFGFLGGLIAGLLIETVAPEASGSGIPQVRARLDRVMMPLNFRIALVKLLGGIMTLGSGLFLGREGPTVQVGAAVAAPLSHVFPTTAAHKRQLIAAGAGAGLAAAFNAPLAGVVFVLEELLKEISASTIIIATVACTVSVIVLNILWPPHIRATIDTLLHSIAFSASDIPFYVLLGVAAGAGGALFNAGILESLNFNRAVLKMSITLRVGLAGLASGAIISALPAAFHDYAGLRALIIAGQPGPTTVLVALVGFFLLAMIAYGSGAPGGLFAPSLALGSAIGYIVGFCEQALTGTGSTVTFALVGMGAFFSSMARIPLTAAVITFELTSNFALLTPLLLSCIVATAVANLIFKQGLYDHLMRWNGTYLRGPDTNDGLRNLQAADVMHERIESFQSTLSIKEVLTALSNSAQRGFPVVERGRLVGIVTQTDLSRLNQLDSASNMTVAEIMTPHPVAVSPHDSLEEILFLFSRYKFTWLPVTSHDQLVGIISRSDVLDALFASAEGELIPQGPNLPS